MLDKLLTGYIKFQFLRFILEAEKNVECHGLWPFQQHGMWDPQGNCDAWD